MRLEQLYYFTIVCQKGSISAACDTLHLTQQSLSANIRSLENDIGAPLLLRTNHGVSITPIGARTLEAAQQIIATWQNLLQEASTANLAEEITGACNVGAMRNIGRLVLPSLSLFCKKKYPNMSIITFEKSLTYIVKSLLNHNLDIGFVCLVEINNISTYTLPDSLIFHKLFECTPHLWLSKQSSYSKNKTLSTDIFRKLPLAFSDAIDLPFHKILFQNNAYWHQASFYKNPRYLAQTISENLACCFDLQYGDYGLDLADVFYKHNVKPIPLLLDAQPKISAGYLHVSTTTQKNPFCQLIEYYYSHQSPF